MLHLFYKKLCPRVACGVEITCEHPPLPVLLMYLHAFACGAVHPDAVPAFGCRAAGAVRCAADRPVPGQNCEREMLVPGTAAADLPKVTGERESEGGVWAGVFSNTDVLS